MMTFMRRRFPVHAERILEDGDVETFQGRLKARVGDWLVQGDGVRPLLVGDALFRRLYVPADDEARAVMEAS